AGMNVRMLGIICALLTAMPNLVGCESSRSQDYQFEKQVKRAQECRQLQDKLVGDQPLTPERGEEIANTMAGARCTAPLPSPDAGVPPRPPTQKCIRKRALRSAQSYLKATDTRSGWQACRCPAMAPAS